MKRFSRRVLLVALLLCLSTFFFACSKSEVPSGMKEASDPAVVDYHLYVPENWTVDMQTGAVSAYFSSSDPSSVNVMAWSVPNTDYKPEQWWEESLVDIEDVYSDFKLESTAETTLDGVAAVEYTWSARIGDNAYRFMQVAAVRKSMVYVFTYGTLESYVNSKGETVSTDRFASHLEDVQRMLQEFVFS